MMVKSYKDHFNEQLKNPEFAKAWEDALPELEIKRIIVEARHKNQWTQKDLAERCGLKQSNISRLETGDTSPTLKTLQQLAHGLDMQLQVRFV